MPPQTLLRKIINYVLLLVVGIICSQIFEDQLTVFMVTLAMGMVLYKESPSDSRTEEKAKTRRVVARRRSKSKTEKKRKKEAFKLCVYCHEKIAANASYCSKCGKSQITRRVEKTSEGAYEPEDVLKEFKNQKTLHDNGIIDETRYSSIIRDTLLVDESKTYWYVSPETSRWYQKVDGVLSRGTPRGRLRIANRNELTG